MADDRIAIMIAWIEEGVEIVRERRRDLGEAPLTRPIKIARCAAWLYDGDRADLAKAISDDHLSQRRFANMNPPTIPVVVGYVLQGIVAKQALAIDRSRPAHRPFALVALYAALIDPIRWPITQQRLAAGHGHPYEGLTLAGWHLDRALFLGWPVALAGSSWTIFAGRAAWPHLLGALGLAVTLGAMVYPAGNSRIFLALAHGLAILAAIVPFAMRLRARRWPSETERLLGVYLAAEMVAWPLLYAVDDRAMGSKLSWGVYLTALAVAIGMQYLWARNIQENRA